MHDTRFLTDVVPDELVQRRESGYAVTPTLADNVAQAVERADCEELRRLLGEIEAAPKRADWEFEEPDELEAILEHAPSLPAPGLPAGTASEDRIHGAWLGRCIGCVLGKPLEGVPRSRFVPYLEEVGAYPLVDYVPADDRTAATLGLHESWPATTRGRIDGATRDDDLDYTILGLHILETYGFEFTTSDVAREWLLRLPFMQIYTAERAAYRNLILGIPPPATATDRNPYREWIGAQIRADVFGYVCPGDPERAARLAYRDARLSHVGNGVYGAMWAAALVASAFVANDTRQALDAARTVVPERSRLADALRHVETLHAAGLDWEQAIEEIELRYASLSFVHAINNAAVVAAALLWSEGDFSRAIALAVQGGWDTDCNGATVGSVCGAMIGAGAIPDHWRAPIRDRVQSALFGFGESKISALAERTARLVATSRPGQQSSRNS
jgi:ADP-ribosylglycohydrolase